PGGRGAEPGWVFANELPEFRSGGKQLGIVKRDREGATGREEARGEDSRPFAETHPDAGTQSGGDQDQAVAQTGMPTLQRDRQFTAPGDAHQKSWPGQWREKLRNVVEQTAKARGVTAIPVVEPAAAT